MKSKIHVTFFIALLSFICFAFSPKTAMAAKGNVRAMVLTGDSRTYNAHEIMGDYFSRNNFGGYNVATVNHYYYYTSQYVVEDHIHSLMNSTFRGSRDNDIVFFYFAGHGLYSTKQKKCLGLCLSDRGSYYSFDNLARHLSDYRGKKYVILDCCYAGEFINSVKKLSYRDREKFEILTATSANKKTGLKIFKSGWDIILVLKDYPRFTYMLAKGVGVKGGSSLKADYNRDGTVTFVELHRYINNNINTSNPQGYYYNSTIAYRR